MVFMYLWPQSVYFMKLFVFPYAGGSQYAYGEFKKSLPLGAEVIFAEYPGRGARLSEPLLDDIHDLASDAFMRISPQASGEYVFWGHSMGAVVAFLVCRKLYEAGLPLPVKLFVSGRNAPTLPSRKEKISGYGFEHFIDRLKALGGTAGEVLDNKELMDFFEPVIRNDFKAIENFETVSCEPLPVVIEVWHGDQEGLTHEELAAWQEQSLYSIGIREFSGNHFFIFHHWQAIAGRLFSPVAKEREMK
jgi:surfactin synthase thioesterase subunit